MPNLSTVVAQVPHWTKWLWWPSYHLLLLHRQSAGELLLMLELGAVALELRKSAQLSRGWRVNHTVLRGSTTRTAFGGSWHGPLPLLFDDRFTQLHSALLINGSTD
jgi:hypothetical protein